MVKKCHNGHEVEVKDVTGTKYHNYHRLDKVLYNEIYQGYCEECKMVVMCKFNFKDRTWDIFMEVE